MSRPFVRLSSPDQAHKIFGGDLKLGGMNVTVGGYDLVFLEEAKRAATRSLRASRRGEPRLEAGGAAAAVLCAAAACEARVSEFLTRWEAMLGPLPAELDQARGNPDALEQWKIVVRFHRPDFALGSSEEYRRLGCLFRLRDHVAHRHARLLQLDEWPRRLSDCVRQRTIPVRKAKASDWTSVIFVHEVAKWAAQTASAWLTLAGELVPETC